MHCCACCSPCVTCRIDKIHTLLGCLAWLSCLHAWLSACLSAQLSSQMHALTVSCQLSCLLGSPSLACMLGSACLLACPTAAAHSTITALAACLLVQHHLSKHQPSVAHKLTLHVCYSLAHLHLSSTNNQKSQPAAQPDTIKSSPRHKHCF